MFSNRAIAKDFSHSAALYAHIATLQRHILETCLPWTESHFPPKATILDVGSGPALFAEMMAQKRPHWHIYNIDIAYGMCTQAARLGFPAITADAAALPIHSNSMDGVLSSCMLQWLPDPAPFFAECARVLKKHGVVIITSFGPNTLHELRCAFANAGFDAPVSKFHSFEAIEQHFTKAGFAAQEMQTHHVVEYYPNFLALLHKLKMIGAQDKRISKRKGLAGHDYFKRAERYYEQHFCAAQGLQATWEVGYWVLKRA